MSRDKGTRRGFLVHILRLLGLAIKNTVIFIVILLGMYAAFIYLMGAINLEGPRYIVSAGYSYWIAALYYVPLAMVIFFSCLAYAYLSYESEIARQVREDRMLREEEEE